MKGGVTGLRTRRGRKSTPSLAPCPFRECGLQPIHGFAQLAFYFYEAISHHLDTKPNGGFTIRGLLASSNNKKRPAEQPARPSQLESRYHEEGIIKKRLEGKPRNPPELELPIAKCKHHSSPGKRVPASPARPDFHRDSHNTPIPNFPAIPMYSSDLTPTRSSSPTPQASRTEVSPKKEHPATRRKGQVKVERILSRNRSLERLLEILENQISLPPEHHNLKNSPIISQSQDKVCT